MMEYEHIAVSSKTKQRLDNLKNHHRQSYNELIEILINNQSKRGKNVRDKK